jgi:hypothetical protein
MTGKSYNVFTLMAINVVHNNIYEFYFLHESPLAFMDSHVHDVSFLTAMVLPSAVVGIYFLGSTGDLTGTLNF